MVACKFCTFDKWILGLAPRLNVGEKVQKREGCRMIPKFWPWTNGYI